MSGRDKETLQGDLLSVETVNGVGLSSGTWSATLAYRLDEVGESFYEKKIEPLDFVEIKFSPTKPKMVGIVDDIRKSERIGSDGRPQKSINMMGRAIVATLQHDNVYFLNPQIEGNLDPLVDKKFLQRTIDFQIRFAWNAFYAKAPQAAVRAIFNQLVTNIEVYSDGKTYKLSDFLNVDDRLFSWKNVYLYNFPELTTFQGNIWNWLNQVIPKPFFEIYTDFSYPKDTQGNITSTDKAICFLYIRPTPFDLESETVEQVKYSESSLEQMGRPLSQGEKLNDNPSNKADGQWGWNQCKVVSIPYADMQSDNTGRSHMGAYSIFEMIPNSMFFPQNSQAFRYIIPPIVQSNLLHLLGARNMSIPTNIIPTTKSGLEVTSDKQDITETQKGTSKTIYERWRRKLYLWFSANLYFHDGQIEIKGNDEIHAGNRVHVEWQNRDYYCEQIKDAWSYGGSWLTTLTVTRGMNEALRKQYWDDAKAFLGSMTKLNTNKTADGENKENPAKKTVVVDAPVPITQIISVTASQIQFGLANDATVILRAVKIQGGVAIVDLVSGKYKKGITKASINTSAMEKGTYGVSMLIDGEYPGIMKFFTKK